MTDRPRDGDEPGPHLTGKTKARKDAQRERLAEQMRKNLKRRKRQQREREAREPRR